MVVLVVGAGPVGLAAAAFLAASGTPVHIIDSNTGPTQLSKALVLWRRSLLTLDPIVPFDHWYTVGKSGGGVYIGDSGVVFRHIDLPNPRGASADTVKQQGSQHALPTCMLVSQADVEAALMQALQNKFGVTVERGTRLASFLVSDAPSDNGEVTCTLVDSQGASKEVQASFVIGCDGARSTVRKQLGLSFEGVSLAQRWLLADVCYVVDESINPNKPQHPGEGTPLTDSLLFTTSAAGLVGLLPVGGQEGVLRIIWNADSQGPAGVPTLADFQALLLANTRLQIRLTEAIWVSEFTINERQVKRYVHEGGRVLLAGDAAHVHSPAGGQGMNTGIQDAVNLAWKVAMAAAGEAAAGLQLLETYHEERWPVGADAIRNSGVLLRANTMRAYPLRLLRSTALYLLTAVPAIRARMVSILAEDDIAYPSSSLNGSAAAAAAAGAAARPASSTCRAVWGSCKPGSAFPNVSVTVNAQTRPATDLLRGKPGCFGSLVLMPAADAQQQDAVSSSSSTLSWPTMWGHWPLNVARVQPQQQQEGQQAQSSTDEQSGCITAVDSWGLLSASLRGRHDVGVLIRPDGIVAVVGGPEVVRAWLSKHVLQAS